MRGLVTAAALAALAGACTGCQDYLARRDTLTAGSGEAVQANAALHVIDPWPRHSRSVDPYTDGDRLQRGVERYRNPVSGPNAAAPGPAGASSAPAPSAPLQ